MGIRAVALCTTLLGIVGNSTTSCVRMEHISVGDHLSFQGFLQNGDLWGLRCSIILHVLNGERERRPWFSSVKWGGEKGHKRKEKRTGSSSLVRNNACKSRLWGSPCTGRVVKKAGHTGVFPPGNNLQQHCFLIWGIMNNTVDSICSFSQRRTFPRLSALQIYWYYREFGEI